MSGLLWLALVAFSVGPEDYQDSGGSMLSSPAMKEFGELRPSTTIDDKEKEKKKKKEKKRDLPQPCAGGSDIMSSGSERPLCRVGTTREATGSEIAGG